MCGAADRRVSKSLLLWAGALQQIIGGGGAGQAQLQLLQPSFQRALPASLGDRQGRTNSTLLKQALILLPLLCGA